MAGLRQQGVVFPSELEERQVAENLSRLRAAAERLDRAEGAPKPWYRRLNDWLRGK